jgi:phosphoribosylformylglycinamidine synthase
MAARNVHFFQNNKNPKRFYAIGYDGDLPADYIEKLSYLTGGKHLDADGVQGVFVGTRKERITPFSTSTTEISESVGVTGLTRFEEYTQADSSDPEFDRMLQQVYNGIDQKQFHIDRAPEPIRFVEDIRAYGAENGLALSIEEIKYLEDVAKEKGRLLTDAEIWGFCQANSEHCRHKIFNGTFVIDGEEQEKSLFQFIKETTIDESSPTGYKGAVKSAYSDNAAVIDSLNIIQWAPGVDGAMELRPIKVGFTLKAETHNHPTGVSPYPGAATGTGGEIRDRFGVGRGSQYLSGTLVIMTNEPRIGKNKDKPESYLYSSAQKILTEGTDGAFHYANEIGQPLVNARVFTYEHSENGVNYGYGKPILQAGGVGFVDERYAKKDKKEVRKGQRIILLGGDNQLIGLGGGSAASLNSGAASAAVDFASVQRDNAEMQNRVFRVVRSFLEAARNPIISIHDHGAGGHFNCLVELVEEQGGFIDMSKLPVGDKTMSAKEIISNESQERMALLVNEEDVDRIMEIARRECCPAYEIGRLTGDMNFVFEQADGKRPVDMSIKDILHNPPRMTIKDERVEQKFEPIKYAELDFAEYLKNVLSMTSVGSKDWMTNKVDRSVTGLVAQQPCVGPFQLPICKYGVTKLDYDTDAGIASTLGYAPVAGLIDAAAGSRLMLADAIAPLALVSLPNGIKDVATSLNWMWSSGNPGEDARLYDAVKGASEFAQALGITVPTGKDSLFMKQMVAARKVMAPGTVIASAAAIASGLEKNVLPVMNADVDSDFWYVNMSGNNLELGGSSFAQSLGFVGDKAPDVDPKRFKNVFAAIQEAVQEGLILAGNSVSSGGPVTALSEMAFASVKGGVKVGAYYSDFTEGMFAENPALVVQVDKKNFDKFYQLFLKHLAPGSAVRMGEPIPEREIRINRLPPRGGSFAYNYPIDYLRDVWMTPSKDLEEFQNNCHAARFKNYKKQPLLFDAKGIKSVYANIGAKRKTTCAVIRDQGTNGDREMQYAAHLGGFDKVKDVHMTDLIAGRENLKTADMAVFPGGFSNADALGAGKGWAAKIKYNARASDALLNFYERGNTLILAVCNGCQVVQELGLIGGKPAPMQMNDSGKFESAFVSTVVSENNAVMMKGMVGWELPVWVAHGEGKFDLSHLVEGVDYQVVLKYAYPEYPGNPNGSPGAVAGIASGSGRITALMPHPERGILPYQWPYKPDGATLYMPDGRAVTPWIQMFIAARDYAAAM